MTLATIHNCPKSFIHVDVIWNYNFTTNILKVILLSNFIK